MPTAEVLVGSWAKGNELELGKLVRVALAEGLNVDPAKQDVSVLVAEEGAFLAPDETVRMARIKVHFWKGPGHASKVALYHALLARLTDVGVAAIKLLIFEMSPQNASDRAPPREPSLDVSGLQATLASQGLTVDQARLESLAQDFAQLRRQIELVRKSVA